MDTGTGGMEVAEGAGYIDPLVVWQASVNGEVLDAFFDGLEHEVGRFVLLFGGEVSEEVTEVLQASEDRYALP